MATSTRSIISAPDFEVDPRLVLPAGVVNVGYTQALNDTEGAFLNAGDAVSGSNIIYAETDAPPATPGVPPPDSAVIISQTIRIVPGGGIVVDVEMEVGDVTGAQSFEVRLAKL